MGAWAGLLVSIILVSACTATTPPSTGSATGADISYVALGDSFTAGTGSTPDQSFPARLVARWSRQGCAVSLTNLGVNGYTTDDLIADELPNLGRPAPAFVTLAIGANDIVHGESSAVYQSHVHQILAAVVAAGVKRIVAIPQPDWSLSPTAAAFGSPAALHASIVQFNAILESETKGVGGMYVDLFPLMEQEATAHMLASDELHPSAAAYDAWGAALASALKSPCSAK